MEVNQPTERVVSMSPTTCSRPWPSSSSNNDRLPVRLRKAEESAVRSAALIRVPKVDGTSRSKACVSVSVSERVSC